MKNLFKLFLSVALLIGLSFSSSLAEGDPTKGQKLYLKFVKNSVDLKGSDFANLHTTDEWKKITETKESFKEWSVNQFPDKTDFHNFIDGSRFDKFWGDIKSFIIHYASDSGNVASC